MRALVSILIPTDNAEEGRRCYRLGAGPNSAPKRSLSSMTAVLNGTLAGARQFESNEIRVVTQPNQRAAAGRVPSAGDTANPDELKDDLEKYEHVQELPSDSSQQNAALLGTPPALNTHTFGLPAIGALKRTHDPQNRYSSNLVPRST